MAALTESVGERGRNDPADVMTVQTLLKDRGIDPGPANGVCSDETIAAIRKFQSSFLSRPDGLIAPGGKTWMRLTAAGPGALASTWSGDSARWTQEKKLSSIHPLLRPKVQATLSSLELAGFRPKIFYGWRSVAVQQRLYMAGNSKVRFSFHNAQMPDGTPFSYAADIIDSRFAWTEDAKTSGFWDALGSEAKRQGLYWGGDWSSFRDWAHVQLVENAELPRVRQESGL